MGRCSLKCRREKTILCTKSFAHGFVVLSETETFNYKCADFYSPEHDGGLLWNDE